MRLSALTCIATACLVTAGCDGNSATGGRTPPPVTTLEAPTDLTYAANPASYTRGVPMTANAPSSSGGAIESYDVSPALPAGLTLDAASGVISGTPSAVSSAATYTVQATNAAGSTTADLLITVVDVPPTSLAYATNPASYTKGTSITSNAPSSSGGAVVSYAVSPALPSGLSLASDSGIISGTPTTLSPQAAYTVTASNSGGATTVDLVLRVVDVAPAGLTYSTQDAAYTTGTAIADNTPSSSGGAVESYSVSPELPDGLSIDPVSGVISGVPITITAEALYTVTATNSGGSTTVDLLIAVNDVAPADLAYSSNPVVYGRGFAISPNTPSSTGGAVVAYSVSPALPPGLGIDGATGIISGTPTAITGQATYTVTATNSGGSTTADLVITVDVAPPRFAYVANADDHTISAYTVDASTGRLRANGYYVVTGTSPSSIVIEPTSRFAYVATSAAISAYRIDGSDGALTELDDSPYLAGTSPRAITIDPSGEFAYVANYGSHDVSAFSIDAATGALAELDGSPYPAGTNPRAVVLDPSGSFAYVVNVGSAGSGTVSTYGVDAATGELSSVGSVPTAQWPTSIGVDPSGRFAYVTTALAKVTAYTIDAGTGALAAMAGSPFDAGWNCSAIALAPSGLFAYVTNFGADDVSAFSIDTVTGALTPVGTPVAAGGAPRAIMLDPAGEHAYVTNYDSDDISIYAIDAGNGSLTLLGAMVARAGASAIAFAQGSKPTEYVPKFAYTANDDSHDVSAFTIDEDTGALSSIAGAPFAAGSGPRAVSADPTGRFVYVANFDSNDVSAYAIEADTGVLTSITGSPFAAATHPQGITVDPSGRFVYVANFGSNDVSAYTIDSGTGALAAVAGSPFAAGTSPFGVTIDPAGRFLYVANADSSDISIYGINAVSGALSSVGSAGAWDWPVSIAFHPSGRFVYVANYGADKVSLYTVDNVTGALTHGIDFGASNTNPASVAVDPRGQFALVANQFAHKVFAHYIDPETGYLFITFTTERNDMAPVSISIEPSGRFAYLANMAGTLSAFRADPHTGALSSITAEPYEIGPRAYQVTTLGSVR